MTSHKEKIPGWRNRTTDILIPMWNRLFLKELTLQSNALPTELSSVYSFRMRRHMICGLFLYIIFYLYYVFCKSRNWRRLFENKCLHYVKYHCIYRHTFHYLSVLCWPSMRQRRHQNRFQQLGFSFSL